MVDGEQGGEELQDLSCAGGDVSNSSAQVLSLKRFSRAEKLRFSRRENEKSACSKHHLSQGSVLIGSTIYSSSYMKATILCKFT